MASFSERFGTDDPRLGNILHPLVDSTGIQVALLGFPHDEGVRRNGGRVGAAKGPDAMRSLIGRTGTLSNREYDIDLLSLQIADAGDIDKDLPLEAAHDQLRTRVADLVARGIIPFVIGGGNDQSFPNAKGLLHGLIDIGKAPEGVTVINIDAHLDVRPLTASNQAHSGSPFRQLCEDEIFKSVGGNLIEFAAQGHQCSKEHWDYVLSQPGGRVISLSQLKSTKDSIPTQFAQLLQDSSDTIFVSFDIDSISGADCPGVSAPAVVGLTADEALQICFEAGKNPKVKLVDVSEFNPDIESYRTGKLVCLMFYFFLMGFVRRINA